jgi:hypothetical protein
MLNNAIDSAWCSEDMKISPRKEIDDYYSKNFVDDTTVNHTV